MKLSQFVDVAKDCVYEVGPFPQCKEIAVEGHHVALCVCMCACVCVCVCVFVHECLHSQHPLSYITNTDKQLYIIPKRKNSDTYYCFMYHTASIIPN